MNEEKSIRSKHKIDEAEEPKIYLDARVFSDCAIEVNDDILKPGMCIAILGLPERTYSGGHVKYLYLGKSPGYGEQEYLVICVRDASEASDVLKPIEDDGPSELLVVTVQPGKDYAYIVDPGILVLSDTKPVAYEKGSAWDRGYKRIVQRFNELLAAHAIVDYHNQEEI